MKNLFTTTALALSCAALLVGCNPAPQDGLGQLAEPLFGLVIDGRIANGLVWVDRNNNGKLDLNFEPYAYTDENGFFSRSEEGLNYCGLPSSNPQLRHCLRYDSAQGNARIMVSGGIDLFTGEPLKGVMVLTEDLRSLRANNRPTPVISPLTTLVASLEDPNQLDLLRAALFEDADENWLTRDFSKLTDPNELDENDPARRNPEMLATGIMILKLRDLVFSLEDSSFDRNSKQAQDNLLATIFASLNLTTSADQVGWNIMGSWGNFEKFYDEYLNNTIALRNNETLNFDRAELEKGFIRLESSVSAITRYTSCDILFSICLERIGKIAEVVHQLNRTAIANATAEADRDRAIATAEYFADPDNLDKLLDAISDNDVALSSLAQDLMKADDLADTNLDTLVSNNTIASLPVNQIWANTWRVFKAPEFDDELTENSYLAIYFNGANKDARSGSVHACLNGELKGEDGASVQNRFIGGNWLVLGQAQTGRIALSLRSGVLEQSGTMVYLNGDEFRFETIDDDGKRRAANVMRQGISFFDGHRLPRNNNDCARIGNPFDFIDFL